MPEAAYDEDRRYTRYNEFRRAKSQALKRDGGRCVCCSAAERLVAHHIVPWILSRSHAVDNLITLCPSCHFVIGDGTIVWTSRGWRKIPSTRTRRIMKRYYHAIAELGHSQTDLDRRIRLLKRKTQQPRRSDSKLSLDDFM
jgi:hypothetical protein